MTEAFDEFPISILHSSVKYSFEKQHGFMNQVRHTLDLAFEEFDLSDREKMINFNTRYLEKRIVFSTCFLHALLTERSYLGYKGFYSKFEITENELIALLKLSKKAVEAFLSSQKGADDKTDISKSPIFQQLAKQVAQFVYGSKAENQSDLDVI